MAQRVIALELLASKESSGSGFFDVAARALTIGLGCRWAGFGRLLDDGRTVEVIAFWDARGPSSAFSYEIDNSPCGEVYSARPEQPYRFFPDGVTERFAGPPVLAQIGAVSYRGEAIFNSDGETVAHAFAIGDRPFDDDPQAEEFFAWSAKGPAPNTIANGRKRRCIARVRKQLWQAGRKPNSLPI